MSTVAVFGMTRNVALAEAKKRIKGSCKNVKTSGGVQSIPLAEWLNHIEKKAEQIIGGIPLRHWPAIPFIVGICGSGLNAC